MIAVKPVVGKLEARVSAYRLPGHCGLLYSPLLEQVGPLATAGGAEKWFSESYSKNHVLQPVLVNVALHVSVSAVGPVPSSRRS
jgi:hypothetical protein